jgi:hypothetical protein
VKLIRWLFSDHFWPLLKASGNFWGILRLKYELHLYKTRLGQQTQIARRCDRRKTLEKMVHDKNLLRFTSEGWKICSKLVFEKKVLTYFFFAKSFWVIFPPILLQSSLSLSHSLNVVFHERIRQVLDRFHDNSIVLNTALGKCTLVLFWMLNLRLKNWKLR